MHTLAREEESDGEAMRGVADGSGAARENDVY